MFVAAWDSATLLFAFVYRRLVYRKVRQTKWYNSYYILLTLFQLYFCIHDLINCYKYEIEGLDFLIIPAILPNDMPESVVQDLQIPNSIAILSMIAPFAVIITIIVTIVHMRQHHLKIVETEKQMEGESMEKIRSARYPHDLCILVLLLPLIYALMAFKSVSRMWMLMTGSVYKNYEEYLAIRPLEMTYYETNYYVADLYEAIGLYSFSRLCVGSVRNVLMEANWGKTAQQLFVPLKKMTLFGVEGFVFTYTCIAIYHLTISISEGIGYPICVAYPLFCGFDSYTAGAGFLASTLAIYNIISFEANLEHYLKEFRPSPKFWGAKVLVSLAFVQSAVINTLMVDATGYYSPSQGKLFYSSLMCIECVGVALLHMYAWDADAAWYCNELWKIPLDKVVHSHSPKQKKCLEEPLLNPVDNGERMILG